MRKVFPALIAGALTSVVIAVPAWAGAHGPIAHGSFVSGFLSRTHVVGNGSFGSGVTNGSFGSGTNARIRIGNGSFGSGVSAAKPVAKGSFGSGNATRKAIGNGSFGSGVANGSFGSGVASKTGGVSRRL